MKFLASLKRRYFTRGPYGQEGSFIFMIDPDGNEAEIVARYLPRCRSVVASAASLLPIAQAETRFAWVGTAFDSVGEI